MNLQQCLLLCAIAISGAAAAQGSTGETNVAIPAVAAGSDIANTDTVKVAIYYPQVPPYMYKPDNSTAVQGIIPDLLNAFFRQSEFNVEYVEESRQRAELKLYDGAIDMMVLSEKWSQQPEQLLYSTTVITHRDYIYTLAPEKLQDLSSIKDSSICLRRHYVYNGLEQALASGRLLRLNADSEFDQMNMLVNGRCDFAYMNEHVAQWLTRHYFTNAELHRSDYVVDETGLTLALSKKWQPLLAKLNAFLQQAQQSGLTDQLLRQHLNSHATGH